MLLKSVNQQQSTKQTEVSEIEHSYRCSYYGCTRFIGKMRLYFIIGEASEEDELLHGVVDLLLLVFDGV
jgi:hypothetical protein